MTKTAAYYLGLPYTIELRNFPDEGWFVRVKELPGCMSQGDTADEALANLQEAMELWLEVSLEHGDDIPEPRSDEDYSGKFVVRVPSSLHRDLAERAAEEGASLNQYVNVALAQAVGRARADKALRDMSAVLEHLARRLEGGPGGGWHAAGGDPEARYAGSTREGLAVRDDVAEYEIETDDSAAAGG
jgi:antitoxin HicB